MSLAAILLVTSFLPVWRIPGWYPDEGYSLWDTIYAFWYEVDHIPTEQAIEEARAYYEEQL